MNIEYSPEFFRCFKKLSKEVKAKAIEKEVIFRKDLSDSRLKIHKLHGKLSGKMAFWIDFKHRIIFSVVNSKLIYFHSIGSHDVYK